MRLARYCLSPNFGDAIMPWLYERITGKRPIYCKPGETQPHILMGGSILNHADAGSVVWGAGLASLADCVPIAKEIRAVRGPLSRMKARYGGNECPSLYGDPAVLAPRFYNPKSKKGTYPVAVFAHYVDITRAYEYFPEGVKIIDPLNPVEQVIDEIYASEKVFSGALHGLIVADAYGIPNQAVRLGSAIGGDGMKFSDWGIITNRQHWGDPPDMLDWEDGVKSVNLKYVCLVAAPDIIKNMQDSLLGCHPL